MLRLLHHLHYCGLCGAVRLIVLEIPILLGGRPYPLGATVNGVLSFDVLGYGQLSDVIGPQADEVSFVARPLVA